MGCEFRRHHSRPSREPFIVLSRSAYLCRCGDRDGRASENPFSLGPQLRDPGDEMVLEAAVNGRAELLVTFNERDKELCRSGLVST